MREISHVKFWTCTESNVIKFFSGCGGFLIGRKKIAWTKRAGGDNHSYRADLSASVPQVSSQAGDFTAGQMQPGLLVFPPIIHGLAVEGFPPLFPV